MPREGIQYQVDKIWRDRVVDRLVELKKNRAWLADESGCPKSMITELLNGKRATTTYLPEIHKALEWPAPLGPMLSKDDEELLAIAKRLNAEQRARLKERGLALEEEQRKSRSSK